MRKQLSDLVGEQGLTIKVIALDPASDDTNWLKSILMGALGAHFSEDALDETDGIEAAMIALVEQYLKDAVEASASVSGDVATLTVVDGIGRTQTMRCRFAGQGETLRLEFLDDPAVRGWDHDEEAAQ